MYKYNNIIKIINSIKINFLTKKQIKLLSNGKITKADTINYKTQKPIKGGLFCNKIFSKIKNNNKYKYFQYNIGHIKLSCTICHPWFIYTNPSIISILLNIKNKIIKDIIYYKKYIIIKSNNKYYKKKQILNILEYNLIINNNNNNKIIIETGAKAIKILLKNINIKKEINNKKNNIKKINLLKKILKKKININNITINILPVIPPKLRPIVKIKNKFASSDINHFYINIINRNLRLKKLKELKVPNYIIRNEKKLLQESIDNLIDNNKNKTFYKINNKLKYKSISDYFKGKQGIFRKNLLGKRVDYSGRAVITVEPKNNINECGIPYFILKELFKPFIYNLLIEKGITNSIDQSFKIYNENNKLIKYLIKKIIYKRPVLLNRAPTLYKMGIQAFYPYITKKNTITINPLVCKAFNADFDGDQMGIHIPILKESIIEIKKIIMNKQNIFSDSNNTIYISPSQESLIGLNILTKRYNNTKKKIKIFYSIKDVLLYNMKNIYNYNKNIYIKINKKIIFTTIGRIIFLNTINDYNNINYNYEINKKTLNKIIYKIYNNNNNNINKLIKFIKKITKLGFKYSTLSGISISLYDIKQYNKKNIINKINYKYNYIINKFKKHKITFKQKKLYILLLWLNIINTINKKSINNIINNITYNNKYNIINKILKTQTKCTDKQITQIIGIRGLILDSDNNIVKFIIDKNLYEGLNSIQYYISIYGARKGLSDTAIKTAVSGYLTRKLIESSRELIIKKNNCYTNKYIIVNKNNINKRTLHDNIYIKNKKINKNTLITNNINKLINKNNIKNIKVKSPGLCKIKNGLCSYCYGCSINKNKQIEIGISAGVIAGQSIGEPGTQLTMRTFHTGGVAIFKQNTIFIKNNKGYFIITSNVKYFNDKNIIKILSKGYIFILTITNKVINKIKIKKGTIFKINKNIIIKNSIKYNNKNNYITKNKCKIYIYCNNYNTNNYYLKYNKYIYNKTTNINLLIKYNNFIDKIKLNKITIDIINNKIKKGIIIYSKIIKSKKIKDITDSLKKISDILEIKKVKKRRIISPFNGMIIKKNNNKFFIYKKNNIIKKYNINNKYKINNKLINILINKGDIISKGNIINNEIINSIGINNFIIYFTNKINSQYKKYNIDINIKHIETVIKPLIIHKLIKNNKIKINNYNIKKYLIHKNIIIGITKNTLKSKSFLSSASFQSTINIIMKAAIENQKNYIKGIKENIIVGNIVPLGTGFYYYKIFNKKTNDNN